ncbi:resolvase [Salmonella enterica subsp. diarizonae]|nr:resolvase [Salmonella enterica]ECC1750587.1 resolvase [Salmonella enterica subsp. diarizonae]ECF0055588.1 resolvase [Salmonella enterica subsp. enterica serovar Coeln]EIM9051355.1 recombinase family protein [Salmonella enterica subsp. enterica serovar Coeln]MJS76377.1 resolvase [Salmonella enterica subsp. enterica serovar Coeln]
MTQTVPKGFVRAYLRASTTEQDATRALDTINTFAIERGLSICNYYIENESGSKLERPELFRLLKDCQQNDILLVEDVDRLSRLVGEDWNTLKKMIRQKDIRVVAVNVPTTWLASGHNDFDSRMFSAINDMLLDMLAAVARRDYEQRRERQQQGIARAKREGKYKGRQVNQSRYDAINRLIASGSSWSQVQKVLGCSRATISKAVRQIKSSRQPSAPEPETRLSAILWVPVANGSKFTRGKKKVKEEIAWLIEADFEGEVLENNEYRLFFTYEDEEDLKEQIDDLFREINMLADMRNCVVDDMTLTNVKTGKSWNEYDGGWYE